METNKYDILFEKLKEIQNEANDIDNIETVTISREIAAISQIVYDINQEGESFTFTRA
ncbi:MAG: hypothetical protein AB7U98_09665 [Candidatus Nitrosocosmicus sp.]